MYLEYYSLQRPPFRITPDPSLFFLGGANSCGVVLEALLYAIQAGEGILKVVGEVGSGKTMICRMLEQRLPESVNVVYLANPKLTPHDILYAVAFELKLDVTEETPRLVLMQKLQSHLLQQHAANRSVLVMIEEAQSMPLETLEEIRLFSNLETHQHKLMQIILFGQPELDKNLQDKSIRQLKERITHSFYLNPLTPEEVSDYLRHRLKVAGCPAPQVFSKAAENLIAKASGGLTRRINILADKAMLAAYSESATATRPRSLGSQLQPTVTAKHVKAAIKDCDYTPTRQISVWHVVFAVMLVIIGILLWQLVIARATQSSTISNSISSPISSATQTVAPDLMLNDSAEVASNVNSPAPTPETVLIEPVPAPETVLIEPVPTPDTTPVLTDTAMPAQTAIQTQTSAVASPSTEPGSISQPIDGALLPGIVLSRIDAYQRLIETGMPGIYMIQVLTTGIEEIPFLARSLNLMDQSGLLNSTYVCLTRYQGSPIWIILFGHYNWVDDAKAAINDLPPELWQNQPFVQNVETVRCSTVRS